MWVPLVQKARDSDVFILFGYWLRGAPGRREAFLEHCRAQSELPDSVREIQRVVERIPPVLAEDAAREVPHLYDLRVPKLAARLAMAAVVLLAVALVLINKYTDIADRTYESEVGVVQHIMLEDGTGIDLNTNSELLVELTASRRYISLTRGEAHFDVARDPSRPFIVHAGHTTVEALGTAFGVRLYDANQVSVIVTEGRVAVTTPIVEKSVVSAGQRLVDNGRQYRTVTIDDTEVESREAWRKGMFIFRNQRLADVIAELNRYTHRQIVIADPSIADLQFDGRLSGASVEPVLDTLASRWNIHARPVPGRENVIELRRGTAR